MKSSVEKIIEQINRIGPYEDDGKKLHEQLGVLCLCKTTKAFTAALIKANYMNQEDAKSLDFAALNRVFDASKKKLAEVFAAKLLKQYHTLDLSSDVVRKAYPHCAYPDIHLLKKYGLAEVVIDEVSDVKESICDLELVLAAAQITYAISKGDKLSFFAKKDEVRSSWLDAKQVIEKNGYYIDHMNAPKSMGGTSETPLTAACLKPRDETAPIVIAFKGTKFKLKEDLYADMHIVLRGVASKTYRDAAYAYYQQIRKENPDRPIILTGHSLGGNLASYVADKAYRFGEKHGVLMVRTFNAAPVDVKGSTVERNREQAAIYDNFVNYRVQNDVVSSNLKHRVDKGIRRGRYGSMVTLASDADPHHAHHLRTFNAVMPDILLKQTIGGQTCLEQEKILGVFETLRYETLKAFKREKSNLTPRNKDKLDALVASFEDCKVSIKSALATNDLDTALVILIEFIGHLNVEGKQSESISNIISDAYGYRDLHVDEQTMSMPIRSYCKQVIQGILKTLSSCIAYLVEAFSSNTAQVQPEHRDNEDENASGFSF